MTHPLTWEEFQRPEIRVGAILSAQLNPAAKQPAYHLVIDFGPQIGTRESSAQLTVNYSASELVGRQILAVLNFPPKQVATVRSQVLVLGLPDQHGEVILVGPHRPVPLGGRVY